MNWLNLEVYTFRSEQYIGSEPIARATWLNVLAWCCEQENCGRIEAASSWGDRRWQQTCGVTKEEVMRSAPLLTWEGDALIVWNYPTDKQEEVQSKRKGGANGGRSRSEAKTQAARINGAKHQPKLNPSMSEAEPKLEPNGKEGKGIGKEEEVIAQAGLQPSERDSIYLAYPRKVGKGKALKEIGKALDRGHSLELLAQRTKEFAAATAAWPKEERQFIPHPATWFSQDRFLDDPAEWSRKSASKPDVFTGTTYR